MKNIFTLVLGVLSVVVSLYGQNPIVPPGMYIADPEAHVWQDGRLYVYGSRDESDAYWCSHSHHVLSTTDMVHWDVVENSFASQGTGDQVDYHDLLLFAPDCAYKNGTYYLYYCSPGKEFTEGVATSKSPYGPFVNGKQIKGAYQIDPAVLIDDDGQGYYYWGQNRAKVAKLKDNLFEIDESTMVEPLDVEGNIAFHEGSSIRKIGDLYYLVFADDSRSNKPTCLGYSISKSPMGPFEYKGVIIDNSGSDPAIWNNHGSIEKFKDQWYVFYHRSTNNSKKFRKVCIEPIFINEDGTIDEVEMTSQGALEYLPATDLVQAEWACQLSGNVRVESLSHVDQKSEGLAQIKAGDVAAFKYLNFVDGISTFEIKASNVSSGSIEIHVGSVSGQLIGTCKQEAGNQNTAYQIISCDVKEVVGKLPIYLVFKGNDEMLLNIDWFRFY